jgi:hypothetical protein
VPPKELARVDPPPVVVELATFSLTSEPAGAEVEVAGEKKGLTPLEVKVDKAKLPVLLKLSREGYEPFQTTLTTASEPALSTTLKKKATGSVRIGPKPNDIKTTR